MKKLTTLPPTRSLLLYCKSSSLRVAAKLFFGSSELCARAVKRAAHRLRSSASCSPPPHM